MDTIETSPLVSVLIPAYKSDVTFLRDAINSILQQTYQNLELLVLNDSPDDPRVESVMREYDDPRIRFLSDGVHRGISEGRNYLISQARGEYLAVMDHDDISLLQRLEKQVECLQQHPEIGVVGCWTKETDSGRIVRWPISDDEIRIGLMYGCVVPHTGCMLRAELLREHHIAYEREFSPAEDYALFARLIPYTQFCNIPEVLVCYRLYADNTSKKQNERMKLAARKVNAFVAEANPELYRLYRSSTTSKWRIRLLGVIPLLSVTSRGGRSKICLFDFIPILTVKHTRKL